jgi:hypothetical protein
MATFRKRYRSKNTRRNTRRKARKSHIKRRGRKSIVGGGLLSKLLGNKPTTVEETQATNEEKQEIINEINEYKK